MPAQLAPRRAAVEGLPHVLRRGVEDVRIDRREDDREGPLPTLDDGGGILAGEETRVRVHLAQIAGPGIEPGDEAAVVRSGEKHVEVLRIGRDIAVLVAA